MPNDIAKTDDIDPIARNERGNLVKHTESEVTTALKLLVINGNNAKLTAEMLAEEGLKVERETLASWRDKQFPRRYHQIRSELAPTISEEIAGRAFERAMQADEAAQLYLEEAVARLKDVPPEHLAKNFQAIIAGYGQLIEKAQTLRGEPNQIEAVIDISDSIQTLERLEVLKRAEAIDVEAQELPDES